MFPGSLPSRDRQVRRSASGKEMKMLKLIVWYKTVYVKIYQVIYREKKIVKFLEFPSYPFRIILTN